MRVERPAASTSAATCGAASASGRGTERGCGLVTISISSPPTPSDVMSPLPTGKPARRRWRTQSNPFSFGLRAQPGAPRTGLPPSAAEEQQIAGIDRHAEMLDPAADRLDRGWNDVAPVGDRRGAEDDDHVGAIVAGGLQRRRQGARLVRHAPIGDDARSGWREPGFESLARSWRRRCP